MELKKITNLTVHLSTMRARNSSLYGHLDAPYIASESTPTVWAGVLNSV